MTNQNKMNKQSVLKATFQECDNHLIASGKYAAAEMSVKKAFKYDEKTGESLEIVNVLEPMKVIKEPEFKHATRNITMSNEFLQMCMVRSVKPHKSASFGEWEAYNNFNKISDEDKVRYQLEKYGHDINCDLISFEIL